MSKNKNLGVKNHEFVSKPWICVKTIYISVSKTMNLRVKNHEFMCQNHEFPCQTP